MRRECLVMPRDKFLEALDLLRRTATRFERDEVVVSFDGDCLHVELGGATVLIPARGRLDSQFRMQADLMFYWLTAPPPGDPIVFEFEDNRLFYGRNSTMVKRQPAWSKFYDPPLNFTRFDLVLLYLNCSEDELERAGLKPCAKKAYLDFMSILDRCEKDFKKEFGVDIDEVCECLREGMRSQYNINNLLERLS